ncbi:sigma-54-dependent Fis family transcriptional regulator [Imbroritus primus]|uniref:Sigma-54-dependent Fis family transcriptional regulator n=1 Tax=Imbroritus primus TaxID=3058603 RepID=A0ACD3SNJ2_9BURK|nr:sigma-54-dependent Fis family transcriptional regulator [Burkholderiaceae bacterium PBA]
MSLQKTSCDDRINLVGDDPVARSSNLRDAARVLHAVETGSRGPATPPALRQFGALYGSSAVMCALYEQVDKVAGTDAPVLICGESGTGKELLAQTLHSRSSRKAAPFIPVNCGAVSAQLSESELFGHEKGSFTGAHQRHIGYFERACGGTLFLDEVTEMPPEMQVKLLRVLETGTFYRVGGTEQIKADVRIIAATNRALDSAVQSGDFREDLMYRLAVVPLCMPPLREREEDIVLLAQHFLAQLNTQHGSAKTLSRMALNLLREQPWRGNVRELKNAILRAYILSDQTLTIEPQCRQRTSDPVLTSEGCLQIAVGMPLAEAQRALIVATLEHCEGNKRDAAERLGISLKTLYNRLALYDSQTIPAAA